MKLNRGFHLIVGTLSLVTLGCGTANLRADSNTNLQSNGTIARSDRTPSSDDKSIPPISRGTIVKCHSASEVFQKALCDAVLPSDYLEDGGELARRFELTFSRVDLNQDGQEDVVAWDSSWSGTGGGWLWVLSVEKDRLRKVGELDMTWSPILKLSSVHGGWHDIAFLKTGGGVEPEFVTIGFDGKRYRVRSRDSAEPLGDLLIGTNWVPSFYGPLPAPKH